MELQLFRFGGGATGNISTTTSLTRKRDVADNYIYTGNIGNDFEVTGTLTPENLSITTGVKKPAINSNLYVHNGQLHVEATAGDQIEVFNISGQKLISRLATEGLNAMPLSIKGVVIVKIGDRVEKIIVR